MAKVQQSRVPAKAANFQVDTRIAVLLGENYASTERALKELVDNAWDADAENVWIELPEPMTNQPIRIVDDGSGMTEQELRQEYLFIANDRQSRKGEFTANKRRRVKGRKGVGKFAGLCAAQIMTVVTRVRGQETSVVIDRAALQKAGSDIERVPLEVRARRSVPEDHGTTIELASLDQNLNFPSPEKFRSLLVRDYGREDGIEIFVNGDRIGMEDVGGRVTEEECQLEEVGAVSLQFTVAENRKRIKGSGIQLRVQGRPVGKPTFLGLDEEEDFPRSLLRQVYGEIEVDGLAKDVTADFSSVIENSKALETVKEWALPKIKERVGEVYRQEMQLAQARLKQKIDRRLAELPEYKRGYAEKALQRVLQKFYRESDERLEPIVNVVLDALERDDYRAVLEHIDDTKDSDVASFAEALEEFGLVDMASIARQARQRSKFLDYLGRLIADPRTSEATVHTAIENNLWLLGSEYGLLSSNRTLQAMISDVFVKKYSGEKSKDRPDLLLAANISRKYVLIEFKAPSVTLKYEHYQQATKYRHEISPHTGQGIEVWLMGGSIGANAVPQNLEPNIRVATYSEVVAHARVEIEWLLQELAS